MQRHLRGSIIFKKYHFLYSTICFYVSNVYFAIDTSMLYMNRVEVCYNSNMKDKSAMPIITMNWFSKLNT